MVAQSKSRKTPSLKAAEGPRGPRPRRALVLGPRDTAEVIGEELRAQGFEVAFEADSRSLRELLEDFVRKQAPGQGAPLLHPGVGASGPIVADRHDLVSFAQELGFSVLSPPVRVLTLLNDKLNLLIEAEKIRIPTPLLSQEPVHSIREIEAFMKESDQGFPFVLRSVQDTGHFGYLVLRSAEELNTKFPLWIEQLRQRTGESIFFLERSIEGARRVVVPFARFLDGRMKIFPKVDSSLQCRHRKIIELCPAFGIDEELEEELDRWTKELADHLGFVGVGVMEFLVDGSRAYLAEALGRLNTGFPLWEKMAGTRAVDWQLATIEGDAEQEMPELRPDPGFPSAALFRIYAEDSIFQLPQPGEVMELSEKRDWKFPGAHAELRLGVEVGKEIPQSGNGTIGFLFLAGKDLKQLMTIARGVLSEVWIAGSLQSNERFLAELAAHPWVKEGIFHTDFIDEEFLPSLRPSLDLVQIFASLPAEHPKVTTTAESRWTVGDQWVKPAPSSIRWVEPPKIWERRGMPGLSGTLEATESRRLRVLMMPMAPDRWQIRIGEWVMTVRQVQARKSSLKLLSLVSGRVHSILYRPGSLVPAHEPLVIVESLGMLVPHALPVETRVLNWSVKPEELIRTGQELASFEKSAKS